MKWGGRRLGPPKKSRADAALAAMDKRQYFVELYGLDRGAPPQRWTAQAMSRRAAEIYAIKAYLSFKRKVGVRIVPEVIN